MGRGPKRLKTSALQSLPNQKEDLKSHNHVYTVYVVHNKKLSAFASNIGKYLYI